MLSSLAYLTDDLPGIGGTIKQRHEDFLVQEEPLYEPSGEGEHLYLFIEKKGMTTMDVARRLAKAFRVPGGDVGYAGLKDKHAVTRQHFSVRLPDHAGQSQAIERLGHHSRITVLWADRHRNKLRRGHLAGNRFVIRIRDVAPTSVLTARRVLDRLAADGIPNFIGQQRFGYRRNGHVLGKLLVLGEYQAFLDEMLGRPRDVDSPQVHQARAAYDRGDYDQALAQWPRKLRYDRQALDALRQGKPAREAVGHIHHAQRELLMNALQSAVFNTVLDHRLKAHTFDRLLPGDLAWKHDNRSVFEVDEATAQKENGPEGRVATMAVSPSGPLWGPAMPEAQGEPGRLEREALSEMGLRVEQLAGRDGIEISGRRRPLRVPLKDPDISGGVDEHGAYVRVAFELPRGSYATVALREIMKIRD